MKPQSLKIVGLSLLLFGIENTSFADTTHSNPPSETGERDAQLGATGDDGTWQTTSSKENKSKYGSAKEHTDRARITDQDELKEAQTTIQTGTEVFRALVKDSTKRVPTEITNNAKCVVIIPKVITAALVVGGTHGNGVATCRTGTDWTAPAFVEVAGGSLGAQIGGKSTDVVLFLLDEEAKKALQRGKFTVGADASVVAGNFERSWDTNVRGIVAYTRTEGAFAGASLVGLKLDKDEAAMKNYYGPNTNYVGLLNGETKVEKKREISDLLAELS